MTRPALTSVTREVVTPAFVFLSIVSMFIYLLLQAYLLNLSLINNTISGSFSLGYKVTLSYYILSGYIGSMPLLYQSITLLTTVLVGLNVALALNVYLKARRMGAMRFTFGGSSLLAVVSSGCPSCGLTAVSLLGPSTGAFSFLLHDFRLQILILGILLFSIGHSIVQLGKNPACKIPQK